MTRKEVIEKVLKMEKVKADAEVVEVLEKILEQVSKKRTSKTPNQKANDELVERIYDFMVERNEAVAVADVMTFLGEGTTNQKATALLRKLVDANRIERAKDGKKTVYTIVD